MRLLPEVESAIKSAGIEGLTITQIYTYLPGENPIRVKTAVERLHANQVTRRRRDQTTQHWIYYHSAVASTGGWQHW